MCEGLGRGGGLELLLSSDNNPSNKNQQNIKLNNKQTNKTEEAETRTAVSVLTALYKLMACPRHTINSETLT